MKLVIAAVLGFTTLLGGSLFYKGSTPVTQTVTAPAPDVVVSIPSPQSSTANSFNVTNSAASSSKSVTKQSVNKDRVLYLNSEVTYPAVQYLSGRLKELNAKSSDPIYLLIDSPGGSVLDGATLISEMEASKAPIYTVCTRLCASMAVMIHSYGTKRFGTDRSILMYHPASGGAQGQVPNMLSQLTTITRYISKMTSNAVNRSKVSAEEFDKLVAYEIWIDAEDATARGLNDGLVNLNVPNSPPHVSALPESEPEETHRNINLKWISPYPELWKRK